MNPSLQITIDPRLTQMLDELEIKWTPRKMVSVIAPATRDLYIKHMLMLEETHPNKMGGTRTHFYEMAANRTSVQSLSDTEAVISIPTAGLGRGLHDVEIVPVNKKWLTIPARAEAYGHKATTFNDLRFQLGKSGTAALIRTTSTAISIGRTRKDGSRHVKGKGEQGGEVMFWLVKSVSQPRDPTLLPTDQDVIDAAEDAVGDYIEATLRGRFSRRN